MSSANGIQIYVPVPQSVIDRIRESTFRNLAHRACDEAEKKKGEKKKGEPLTEAEAKEIMEKLRDQLEVRGFFRRR